MAVRSTQKKPPQTHTMITIIVIQVDVVMGVLGGCFCSSTGGAAALDGGSSKTARVRSLYGSGAASGRKSVLELDQSTCQQLGDVVRSGGKNHYCDRRLSPKILDFDPELDR